MGLLVDGVWQDSWYSTKESGGRFVRKASSFRRALGSPELPAESGRYELIVSAACPWAHRTLVFRALKGLTEHIDVHFVDALMLEKGWTFAQPLWGRHRCVHEVYTRADPSYTGRVTVPILWDTKTETIVNNESSELIRAFNDVFDDLTGNPYDFNPPELRERIAPINDRIYRTVNNGVYRCGFATTQAAYDAAVVALFDSLEWIEGLLAEQPFLGGDRVTEADWRLWTTLVRFDAVYVTHFKCDHKRIVDLPNLWAYARQLAQVPGVWDTVQMATIRQHYFGSHETVNPHRIVSMGPANDWMAPHGRGPALETARR
ncbi:MAG: glutathione S-transferase family protein [Proteobacteria bacterium]|nr:glutathione S-transferase family protein [Pseudomonadota bacterium]MCP4918441.1 glutathione S-transferase family protein [Pseudomonadota bacterium]